MEQEREILIFRRADALRSPPRQSDPETSLPMWQEEVCNRGPSLFYEFLPRRRAWCTPPEIDVFLVEPPPDAATIWRGSDAGDRTDEYGNVEDTTPVFVLRSTGHPAGFRSGSCTCASFWPKNLGLGETMLLCS